MPGLEKYNEKAEFMDAFENFRPDLFYPEAWSEKTKAEVAEEVRPTRVKTGMLSAIPMTCRGPACSFAEVCPLLAKGIAPLKSPCPIEMSAVKVFFDAYVEELDVDTTKMVEVSMVRDLVDQEIQQNRATWLLSLEHFIQDAVIGISPEGKPIVQQQLHLAVEMQEKLFRRKEKLRSALLATREARAKAGQGHLDNAQVVSNLMESIRVQERKQAEALRKRLNMADPDEYIEAEEAEIVEGE